MVALYFGNQRPGMLAASAGNDAGGIATYASAGATYGYSLLWVMVLITVAVAVMHRNVGAPRYRHWQRFC
jgi:Mn2+/Fe2+ NRAMP family transporter